MSAFEQQPCVGLFGTCGDSTFRQDLFIPVYEREGIDYFNPQVADWKPEYALNESDHLTYDVVQCWPVLSSTYGSGSLAEQGYSIASTLRSASPFPKFVIPMIELTLDDDLTDEVARSESLRARQIASVHLRKSESPFIYPVETLEEMLAISISLYGAAKVLVETSQSYNPSLQRYIQERRERENFARSIHRDIPENDTAS
jgi:hypothetical protein